MNFSKIRKTLSVAIFSGIVATSCTQDPIGPELRSAPSDFSKNVTVNMVTGSINDTVVKFYENDDVYFESSEFSHEVTWTLVLKGLSSGAEKKFTATSKKITTSDAKWSRGECSTIQFFQQGEQFLTELHIVGLDTVFGTEDTLLYESDFDWNGAVVDGVTHSVVEYFDQGISYLTATGPDANDDNVQIKITDAKRILGGGSLIMKGFDANSNGWLGDVNHERLLEFVAVNNLNNLPIDSSAVVKDLYFNLYVFGDPKFPNTAVELKMYENDDPNIKNRDSLVAFANDEGNTLGADIQGFSDAWIYDIQINWEGWKLVSIPYSSFRAANSLTSGGGGNRIKQPWRITAVAVSILSFPTAGKEVSTYVDFFTVTQGGRPKN